MRNKDQLVFVATLVPRRFLADFVVHHGFFVLGENDRPGQKTLLLFEMTIRTSSMLEKNKKRVRVEHVRTRGELTTSHPEPPKTAALQQPLSFSLTSIE